MDDLARAFFDTLYDLRLPIAIGSMVAAGVVAAVGWQQGWFAAARRHPGRATALVGVTLAVAIPLAWYLASPLWIRTSLVEAVPSPDPSAPPSVATSPRAVTPSATPFVRVTHASGEFSGTDDFHFGRGTASLIEVRPGRFHLRLEDFSVRNGPDLYVYLSTAADDYAKGSLELGRLKATDGSFGYDVPEGTDVSRFRSAIIWCKQFSHLFAVAPF